MDYTHRGSEGKKWNECTDMLLGSFVQNSIYMLIPVVVYDIMLLKFLFKQKLAKRAKVILALAMLRN